MLAVGWESLSAPRGHLRSRPSFISLSLTSHVQCFPSGSTFRADPESDSPHPPPPQPQSTSSWSSDLELAAASSSHLTGLPALCPRARSPFSNPGGGCQNTSSILSQLLFRTLLRLLKVKANALTTTSGPDSIQPCHTLTSPPRQASPAHSL